MRSLADEWQCDPSNATFIVDRLEELGLASRQPLLHDKRVKLVVLTRKGEKTRTDLLREFHQPPPEFERLERADLEALERMLAKLTPAPSTPVGITPSFEANTQFLVRCRRRRLRSAASNSGYA